MHTDSSVVFARWHQCASWWILQWILHGSLGRPESTNKWHLNEFSHSSMATVNMYRKFCEFRTCHFMQAHRQRDMQCAERYAHCNTARLTIVTDRQNNRQTDHATPSVAIILQKHNGNCKKWLERILALVRSTI